MPRFAANLGYLFTDRPLLGRIDAAAASGFKAIELQFPYDVPASQVKEAIARNKLTVLGINTPPGAGDGAFGLAAIPGREKEFQEVFARALDYISTIGGSAVHCLAGKVPPEQRPAAERVFIDNLKRAADLAAAKNISLLIEPINARRPAGLFPQPRRARRRRHRQGRQAEHPPAVRFLSRADRRRRHRPPAGEIHAGDRPSAMRRGALAARAGRAARSIILTCSRKWTGWAMPAGSVQNTGRDSAPKRGWAGQSPTAWCRVNH